MSVIYYTFCSTQMCTNDKLSDKTLFPTFARTIPPISRLAPPVHALMKHFNWTHVGIITQGSQQWTQWNVFVSSLRKEGVTVNVVQTMKDGVHYNNSGLSHDFQNMLQEASRLSRGKPYVLRKELNTFSCFSSVNSSTELHLQATRGGEVRGRDREVGSHSFSSFSCFT